MNKRTLCWLLSAVLLLSVLAVPAIPAQAASLATDGTEAPMRFDGVNPPLTDSDEDIWVYFVDETDCANAWVYPFLETVSSESGEDLEPGDTEEDLPTPIDFPGIQMTALGTEKGGHNYYCYVLSISDYSHVIFSNGSTGGVNSGNQTPDLPAKASARIDDNGRKYVVYYIYRDNGLMAASIGDDVWPNPMVTVEPTCTEPGYTRYEGLITGAVYGETTYEALGHLPGETEIENEIPATCTAPGSYDEVVYCQRCNAELTRTTVPTEQLDHVPGETVIENEVPATCTAPGGYDEVISCTLCGAQISRTHVETPQLPHTPGATVIENVDEPTCTAPGGHDEVVYCTVCSSEISRFHVTDPALGHNWGEWLVDHEPTCTDMGVYYHVCARCGLMEQQDIDALGHDPLPAEQERYVAATCTTEGGFDMVVRCRRCNSALSSEHTTLPALGHNWGAWQVDHAPTCTDWGVNYRVCGRCNLMEQEDIEPLGHTPGEPVAENEIPATCTEEGSVDYVTYCTVCGAVLLRDPIVIPMADHTPGEPVAENQTAPTCTEPGTVEVVIYCTVCGQDISREPVITDDPLGHLPQDPVRENYVAPTLTEYGGYDNVVYCERCGAELNRDHVVLPPIAPVDTPEYNPLLTFYTSISIGMEVKTTFTVRTTVLSGYDSWYLELSKLDGNGEVMETKRFGEGQEGPVTAVGTVAWRAIYTDITAKEMGVTFSATLHAFNAEGHEYYGDAVTNTVKDYVVGELTKTDNTAATRTLCADMLNYGAAAQTYFEYDTENLVNQNLSAAAASALSQFETKTQAPAALVNGSNGPNLYGSVSIKNRVVLSITARGLSTEGTVKIQVKKQGSNEVKEVLETTKVGSVYTAKFSNAEANEMRDMFEFTALVDGVETGTPLLWSVEGYVRAARLNSSTSAAELALLNALLIYTDSAAAMS